MSMNKSWSTAVGLSLDSYGAWQFSRWASCPIAMVQADPFDYGKKILKLLLESHSKCPSPSPCQVLFPLLNPPTAVPLTTSITSCCTCGPNAWNLKSELLRECFSHFTPLYTLIFLHAFVFILPSRRCLLDAYYKLLGLTCKPSKICTSSYHLAAVFCMSSAIARVSYILIHWMGVSILYILLLLWPFPLYKGG